MKCSKEVAWGFLRDWLCNGRGVCGRCESEGAGVEHPLCKVVSVGVGCYAEVAAHGIGLPVAEKLDDVRVDAGAQEGGGPARAEASGTDEEGVDASEVLDVDGGMT